jgi:hypothetical protein
MTLLYIFPVICTTQYTPSKQEIKIRVIYRVGDMSLAPSGRKQATGTEDFDVHISYL